MTASPRLRVTFVTPRFGPQVVGGAERVARAYALGLSRLGHEVRVLTTTATSLSWTPALPAGESFDEDVLVVRRHARPRLPLDPRVSNPCAVAALSLDEGRALLEAQGPVFDDDFGLLHDADVVVAYPYLYWTTLRAVEVAGRRSVLHPAAHPEPLLRLGALGPVFERPGGIVYQTVAEQRLVEASWQTAQARAVVVTPPLVQPITPHPAATPRIVLAVGRFERDKGARALSLLAEALPDPIEVVVVGPIIEPPPRRTRLRLLGVVDDATLANLRSQALCSVVLSRHESFSLAAAEALAARLPIVVNAHCEPLVELARESGAGFVVKDALDAASAVVALATEPPLRARLSDAAAAWAARSIDPVRSLRAYEQFLHAVAREAPPTPRRG